MLTVEKYFCRAMRTLWTEGETVKVPCVVSYPDENWVKDSGGDKACVFADDVEIQIGASDRMVTKSVAGEAGEPSVVYRAKGEASIRLEVRIRAADSEKKLNELVGQFLDAFPMGTSFGPEGDGNRFQIDGNPKSRRVRVPDGAARLLERVISVPVAGPYEETGEAWPVETVEIKVAT